MELTRAPGSSAALGLCARRSWEPVRFTDRVKASKDCEEDATCRAPARPAAAVKSATEKRGRTPARSTETPACCFARLRAAEPRSRDAAPAAEALLLAVAPAVAAHTAVPQLHNSS